MHWEPHEMALPKLPKDMGWVKIFNTANEQSFEEDETIREDSVVNVEARSVVVYRTQKCPFAPKKQRISTISKK